MKVEDVTNALSIFGPDLAGVREKTVRTKLVADVHCPDHKGFM